MDGENWVGWSDAFPHPRGSRKLRVDAHVHLRVVATLTGGLNRRFSSAWEGERIELGGALINSRLMPSYRARGVKIIIIISNFLYRHMLNIKMCIIS